MQLVGGADQLQLRRLRGEARDIGELALLPGRTRLPRRVTQPFDQPRDAVAEASGELVALSAPDVLEVVVAEGCDDLLLVPPCSATVAAT